MQAQARTVGMRRRVDDGEKALTSYLQRIR
jgi:hypothetical protein